MEAVPVLAYTYAVCLTKAGDYTTGIQKPQVVRENANPDDANIHKALGEAFAAHGDYAQAVEELRTATRQNPSDKDAALELNTAKQPEE